MAEATAPRVASPGIITVFTELTVEYWLAEFSATNVPVAE